MTVLFSTMLKSWLSCFYFTYAAHWSNRSRLDIHWNQCAYFFWLILLLSLLNIDLNTFFPDFYDVILTTDAIFSILRKWHHFHIVIQHINSYDKFSSSCIFPICLNLINYLDIYVYIKNNVNISHIFTTDKHQNVNA